MSATRLRTWHVAALILLSVALGIAVLFVPAGRLDWNWGWLYLGLLFGAGAILAALLYRKQPGLFTRRLRAGAGTKAWDRVMVPLLKLGFTAALVLGAADAGRGGATMSTALWVLGAALHLGGFAIFTWAILANPHFESTVRIQTDHDHRVIDTGPYRIVRHPGYTGFAQMILAVPLLLGSWWAFIPALATIFVLLMRTLLEDRTLQRELPGYAAYAERVRSRIIPWVF